MSTSLLYHGWGIVGYEYQRTLYAEGTVFFRIAQDPTTLKCPRCESRKVIRRGVSPRRFLTLPIGRKRVIIEFPRQRVECKACGAIVCRQQEWEF